MNKKIVRGLGGLSFVVLLCYIPSWLGINMGKDKKEQQHSGTVVNEPQLKGKWQYEKLIDTTHIGGYTSVYVYEGKAGDEAQFGEAGKLFTSLQGQRSLVAYRRFGAEHLLLNEDTLQVVSFTTDRLELRGRFPIGMGGWHKTTFILKAIR